MSVTSPAAEQPAPSTAANIRLGVTRSIPIVLGYAPVAFAYGVLAAQNGMPVWLAVALSYFMFAGSGQFIAISVWFSGAGLLSTVIAVLVTNLRYVLMSVALAPYVRRFTAPWKAAFGWHVTDELFAVHIAAFKEGWEANRTAIFSCTGMAQASWVIGTLVGGLCGGAVTDVRPLGLDYALTGMFLALLIPQCVDKLHILTAVLAAFLSVAIRGAGLGEWNVVLATLIAATIGMLLDRMTGKDAGAAGEDR